MTADVLVVFVPPVELEEGIEVFRQSWADLEEIIKAQKSQTSEWDAESIKEIFMGHLLSVREECYKRVDKKPIGREPWSTRSAGLKTRFFIPPSSHIEDDSPSSPSFPSNIGSPMS